MTTHTSAKFDKKKNLRRAILISSMLIINVLVIYLYYYVLIFKSIEHGKVYGESTFNGGRYEIYTLKYYYEHKHQFYFDKIDFVMAQDIELGDSLELRVFNPRPQKHMIQKAIRNNSIKTSYHPDKGFKIQYNELIENIGDYDAPYLTEIQTSEGNHIRQNTDISSSTLQSINEVVDKIHFNKGSLIKYYSLNAKNDTVFLRAVYHYLNDFSTDAMPSYFIHQQLSKKLPYLHLHISVVDYNHPKKEHILDINQF